MQPPKKPTSKLALVLSRLRYDSTPNTTAVQTKIKVLSIASYALSTTTQNRSNKIKILSIA